MRAVLCKRPAGPPPRVVGEPHGHRRRHPHHAVHPEPLQRALPHALHRLRPRASRDQLGSVDRDRLHDERCLVLCGAPRDDELLHDLERPEQRPVPPAHGHVEGVLRVPQRAPRAAHPHHALPRLALPLPEGLRRAVAAGGAARRRAHGPADAHVQGPHPQGPPLQERGQGGARHARVHAAAAELCRGGARVCLWGHLQRHVLHREGRGGDRAPGGRALHHALRGQLLRGVLPLWEPPDQDGERSRRHGLHLVRALGHGLQPGGGGLPRDQDQSRAPGQRALRDLRRHGAACVRGPRRQAPPDYDPCAKQCQGDPRTPRRDLCGYGWEDRARP
mmetsp:Transcript_53239/g.169055  ORF Transcript_53239/g.169055 Transcript_53239/m.169055 type:complete len:333 (-) Transcript_53239:647-1645(-)